MYHTHINIIKLNWYTMLVWHFTYFILPISYVKILFEWEWHSKMKTFLGILFFTFFENLFIWWFIHHHRTWVTDESNYIDVEYAMHIMHIRSYFDCRIDLRIALPGNKNTYIFYWWLSSFLMDLMNLKEHFRIIFRIPFFGRVNI